MRKIIFLLALIFYCSHQVFCVSIYSWTLTGRKFCWNNATKEQTDSLLQCDKLMRPERKKLLEICLKKVVDYTLTNDIPTICSYSQKEKDFQVMDCMFNKTGEVYGKEFMSTATEENFDAIDAVENDYEWCIMKAASVYGFEHLCEKQLNDKQTSDIKSCDKAAKDMIDLMNNCRKDAKLEIDNRPAICDFYKNVNVLNCWNKRTLSLNWTENGEHALWNKYIECLDDIQQ